jgi:recombination protein RecA
MSQALRKLTAAVHKSGTALIFINQLRSKIGVMFGDPTTTTGGNALKFYSSVRIDVRRVSAIKDGDTITGNRTKVKIVKSKVSIPFKTVELDIINPNGFDIVGDVLDCAVEFGVIKKGGAWFTYGEERFQGRDKFKEFLKSDPIFLAKLKEETIVAMKTNKVTPKQQEVLPPL